MKSFSKRLHPRLKKKKRHNFISLHCQVPFMSCFGIKGLSAAGNPVGLWGCGALSMAVSPGAQQTCSSQPRSAREPLPGGEIPELPAPKAQLKHSLLLQVLFGNAQSFSTVANRQRFSRIHFLSNNSFQSSQWLCPRWVPAALSVFNLHTGFVQDAVPASPPLQLWHFPGWQPKGCLGRLSCRQKAKAGLLYICSKRGRMKNNGLHPGKISELITQAVFACNECSTMLEAGPCWPDPLPPCPLCL